MNKYTVKIKALTPIWTGDADGKNTTLRETGIIGSIRWWHEALIRGLVEPLVTQQAIIDANFQEKKNRKRKNF